MLDVKFPIKCCSYYKASLSSVGILISNSEDSLKRSIKFSRFFLWFDMSLLTIYRAARCFTYSSTACGRPAIDLLA